MNHFTRFALLSLLLTLTACIGANASIESDPAQNAGTPEGENVRIDDVTCPGTGQQTAAFFSRRPPDGGDDFIHERTLVGLLDCAVPGSTVRVSIFRISRPTVAEAFARTLKRGVDVQLILDIDKGAANENLEPVIRSLKDSLGSALTICGDERRGGCVGSNINHNKFAVFEALADGSTQVVMQSSSNMVRERSLHNNTIVLRGDFALYEHYMAYWSDQHAQVRDPDYYQRLDGDTSTRIYLSPRKTGDTVLEELGNMECPGGELRVAMSLFGGNRTGLPERLVEMKQAGCSVELVLRGDEDAPPAVVIDKLRTGGVPFLQYVATEDGWNVHSKYWIWNGIYEGSAAPRKVVFTGSHNWTTNALRNNDETILRIEDDAIYDAFVDDFVLLQVEAAR